LDQGKISKAEQDLANDQNNEPLEGAVRTEEAEVSQIFRKRLS